jgi:hypothetical protein
MSEISPLARNIAAKKDILWGEKCPRGRHCMKERRLTLDTNILFYAMDQDAGSRHNLAMGMLIALQSLIVFNPAISL